MNRLHNPLAFITLFLTEEEQHRLLEDLAIALAGFGLCLLFAIAFRLCN